MSIESTPDGEVSPLSDLLSALVWMVLGAAIAVGAWRMDRLEHLHINQYEIPGLVPGLLGFAVLVLGLALAVRAVGQGALRQRLPSLALGAHQRMLLIFAAMLGYSLLLVGRGIPFWLATFVFVSAFIFFFDRERQADLGRSTPRQLMLALICGAVTSATVSLAFQNIFYVRLP